MFAEGPAAFFPDFPLLDRYVQQRSLDPGRYRVVETQVGWKLVNRLTVSLARARTRATLTISKTFGPAPNPLRHERGLKLDGVEYAGYTQSRRPVQLVYSESFPTRDEAFAAERRLKGWSRQKKEALIDGDWERLSRLAQRRSPSA